MFLEETLRILQKKSRRKAYSNYKKSYSYSELYQYVCNLYYFILKNTNTKTPIVIYGHKEIYMKAAFLACSFAGISYVPIDSSLPLERVSQIVSQIKPEIIFGDIGLIDDMFESDTVNVCKDKSLAKNFIKKETTIISSNELFKIMNATNYEDISQILLQPEDIYYIIFTSGTTGVPKGVKVTYRNLDSCMKWLISELGNKNEIILSQANFSFDLSIADLYFSILTESEQFVLERDIQLDFEKLFSTLKIAQPSLAVMTPSFAELLLLDKSFCNENFPNLKRILFCGEKLLPVTVEKIFQRFNNAIEITNFYGPTECTFAVTSVKITQDMLSKEDLPIGIPKEDTQILIVNEEKETLEDEQIGEILIVGESVAQGYWKQESFKFFKFNNQKAYLTGDLGFLKNGMLYYKDRKDSQVKYKGYRIELDDIEKNLLRLSYVENAIVIPWKNKEGQILKLIAFLTLKSSEIRKSLEIKSDLSKSLPKYMIPNIRIVEKIPLTLNGKCDKQKLLNEYIKGEDNKV